VLLVDHDMAVSTLAARAAASARANIYAVVSSGLGALDSALHGNASAAAHALIIGVGESGRAEQVVGEWIRRTGRGVPGFGHVLYSGRDPRATALLALLASVPGAERTMAAAQATIDVVTGRTGAEPNIDFALAALTVASGMRADAGEAVFAVARTGGWIIHALAEYRMPPLRLRPVGRYVGP
jgi:citrate synthase